MIGKVLGTSAAGGASWQNQQEAMSAYSAKLQAAAGHRIVGAFVPRGATAYAVVIRLSGSEPAPTLEALAARARFGPAIQAAQDGVGGIGPDEATSEIAIAVTVGVGDPALARAQAAATFGAAGIPFRIDLTSEDWRIVPY